AARAGGAAVTGGGGPPRTASSLPLPPIAVIPPPRVPPGAARTALPAEIPHADGAFTASHALLLGAGLAAGNAEWLSAALADRLHEPYRATPLLDQIRSDLPTAARGATLSGSGPTVLVWADDPKACAAALTD